MSYRPLGTIPGLFRPRESVRRNERGYNFGKTRMLRHVWRKGVSRKRVWRKRVWRKRVWRTHVFRKRVWRKRPWSGWAPQGVALEDFSKIVGVKMAVPKGPGGSRKVWE